MAAFWQSLFFILVAEMGDKSQLVAIAFAARYSARIVLAGIFLATLLVHLGSVVIGETIALALPAFWTTLIAGVAFLGFGAWTLRGDSLDDDAAAAPSRFGPFFAVAATFFVAELGDKTMLATVTLAGQLGAFVPVWLGSTVGMVVADAIAIGIGMVAGKRLPERAIRYGAAAIFLGTGAATIGQALLAG